VTDVAVVIGNHQGERLLPDCLASLAQQTLRPTEIVVIDGGSSDRSREVAERHGVRFVQLDNRGLGYLYNAGVRATTAPYALLSNNDVAYESTCVELLAQALDEDNTRFAADGLQLDWEARRVVKAQTTIRRGALFHEYIPGLHLDHAVAAATTVPTVAAHGASMLVRREKFVALGGFDETFFLDAEDLDLCWRAWLHHWPSVYVPEARLRHRVGGAMSEQVRTPRLISGHHNMLRFAFKCLPADALARALAGELLRLPRHPRVIPPALLQILRELPEILKVRRRQGPSSELFEWMLRGQPSAELGTGVT
jgi:GT2 family glycosyltransferase